MTTIELKNVRRHADMSDETECFSASLYIDGKRVTDVRNAGHGGCHEYGDYKATSPHEDAAQAWCAENLDWWKEGYSEAFDSIVDHLVSAVVDGKRLKRLSKKNVLFRLPEDGPNEMRTYKITARFTREVLTAHVEKNHPGAVFIDVPEAKVTI